MAIPEDLEPCRLLMGYAEHPTRYRSLRVWGGSRDIDPLEKARGTSHGKRLPGKGRGRVADPTRDQRCKANRSPRYGADLAFERDDTTYGDDHHAGSREGEGASVSVVPAQVAEEACDDASTH